MEFRKKKEENCLARFCKTREVGDAYSYLAFKRNSKLLICHTVGKWNDFTCDDFYKKLSHRIRFPTRKNRVTIFSDGNKQNITAIKKYFPQGSINYGLQKKIRKNQKIVGIVNKVKLGKINKDQISIQIVDCLCSKLRERISCFTRKARSFAKKKKCIEQRLEIFSIQHNFMESKKGKTPAMIEGLTNKKWTWNNFFNIRLSTLI